MRFSLVLTILLMLPQLMWGYSRVKNGGAGFYQNGEYLTFYSAKLKIRSTSLKVEDVPGLSFLIDKINKTPLNPQIKASLLTLIYPVGTTRTYYKIADGDLDPQSRKEMIDEYSKLTGEPVANLVLFAMTNDRQETFLLPEFDKLTELQKAVMLLHESLWNLHVEISYNQMVTLEMAAEDYFNHPSDASVAFKFLDLLGQMMSLQKPVPEVLLQGAFYYTYLQHPPERPQIETVPLNKVFNFNFVHCNQEKEPMNLADCSLLLQTELMTKNGGQLTWFETAILGVLNNRDFNGFLCFKEATHGPNFNSKFGSDTLAWLDKTSIATPMQFWQEDEKLPEAYGKYSVMSKMFKLFEGNTYWGDLGVCYIPPAPKKDENKK